MTSPYAVKIPVRDDNEKALPKVYFQVLLRYNLDASENEGISEPSMESPPLETESKAESVLKGVCQDITKRIEGAEAVRIPIKERIDDFSIVIIRKRESKDESVLILARMGIIKVDYSKEKIH